MYCCQALYSEEMEASLVEELIKASHQQGCGVNLEGEETQQARLTSWYDDIRLQRFDMALTPLQKMAAFILFICALLLLRDCGQDEVQWCFLWSESV